VGWALPAISVLAVLVRSTPAPLGEPVADDFDFLYVQLRGPRAFFSGGGSASFWRPIPHQVYYATVGRLLFSESWIVPALNAILLCAAGYLVMRALKPRLSVLALGSAVSFALLSEPCRAFMTWASHFVEVSYIFGVALSLFCAAGGLPAGAGLSLVLALLCKEAAALGVPLLAAVPDPGSRIRRVPLALWLTAGLVLWAVGYRLVATHNGLAPPSSITTGAGALIGSFATRLIWSFSNTFGVGLGVGALRGSVRALVGWSYLGLILVALVRAALGPRASRRPLDRPLALWSIAWWVVMSAGLMLTYPVWAPYRAVLPTLGLGLLLCSLLQSVDPRLTLALVAIKAAALVASPQAPLEVGVSPPSPEAFVSFQRLVRLQLLARDTRTALHEVRPALPTGAVVVARDFPLAATYALSGDKALRVWFRDTTLQWVGYDEFRRDRSKVATCLVQYEGGGTPSVRVVSGQALALQLSADSLMARRDSLDASSVLKEVLAAGEASVSGAFEASTRFRLALCLESLGRHDEAETEARRAAVSPLYSADARFFLALLLADRGRYREALDELDRELSRNPGDARMLDLRTRLREAIAAP
jgi:hypothetical protein